MPHKKKKPPSASRNLALMALFAAVVSFFPTLGDYGLYVFILAFLLLITAVILAIANAVLNRRSPVNRRHEPAPEEPHERAKACRLCGRKGRLATLDSDGYCPNCAKYIAEMNERRRQEEARRQLEKARVCALVESVPEHEIILADRPHKRNTGYEAVNFSNITPKGNYDDIVVFDTETTGLAPSKDRIIEIAAIRFVDRRPVSRFHTYVNPEMEIPADSIAIHGITNDMVANSPPIGRIIPAFDAFVGASTLVAHNLDFDLRFAFYSGSELLESKRKYIDTLAQARKVLKKPRDVEDHKLATLCDYYKITIGQEHSALYDAYATGELFFLLVDEIQ